MKIESTQIKPRLTLNLLEQSKFAVVTKTVGKGNIEVGDRVIRTNCSCIINLTKNTSYRQYASIEDVECEYMDEPIKITEDNTQYITFKDMTVGTFATIVNSPTNRSYENVIAYRVTDDLVIGFDAINKTVLQWTGLDGITLVVRPFQVGEYFIWGKA